MIQSLIVNGVRITERIEMKLNKGKIKKGIQFIANPRLIICFGLAWLITNGWSYILLGIGTLLNVSWMIAVASGYLAFKLKPFFFLPSYLRVYINYICLFSLFPISLLIQFNPLIQRERFITGIHTKAVNHVTRDALFLSPGIYCLGIPCYLLKPL